MKKHWFSWFIWALLVALDLFVLWAAGWGPAVDAGILIAFNVVGLLVYGIVYWLEGAR